MEGLIVRGDGEEEIVEERVEDLNKIGEFKVVGNFFELIKVIPNVGRNFLWDIPVTELDEGAAVNGVNILENNGFS
jgi:hypothetical protein